MFVVITLLAIAPFNEVKAPPRGYNYEESKVPEYELPDPLVCLDGSKVKDAETWRKKRLASRLINKVLKNGRQIGIKRIYATWLPGNDAVRRIITSQGGKCWHEGGVSRGAFFVEPLDVTQAKTGQLLRSI